MQERGRQLKAGGGDRRRVVRQGEDAVAHLAGGDFRPQLPSAQRVVDEQVSGEPLDPSRLEEPDDRVQRGKSVGW